MTTTGADGTTTYEFGGGRDAWWATGVDHVDDALEMLAPSTGGAHFFAIGSQSRVRTHVVDIP